MNELAGPYDGLDRFECRKKIVADLKEQGILTKIEEHTHSVGHSERSGAVVEPYLSTQWFVRMQPLAELPSRMPSLVKGFALCRIALKRSISIGLRTSEIGASPVNFGGATEFRPGTVAIVGI